MTYHQSVSGRNYSFGSLVEVLAKATPLRSGDQLAGCAAESDAERAAACWVLADLPLTTFLDEQVVPYETDAVTRLIVDGHDRAAFAPIAHLTVGGFRDWLLATAAGPDAAATLSGVAAGLTPEMVAAVSKLMRNQDLIAVAKAATVTSAFRTTIGLPGRIATRLQPNHPTDDPRGIAAATLDGLLMGCGDAVIGINPATDSPRATADLLHLLDDIRTRFDIPMQSCVLSHVTTTMALIERNVPVDLVF
ncbi:ethanolamine ammonia-lyase subunit EutB, partial [Nocardia farcinica]